MKKYFLNQFLSKIRKIFFYIKPRKIVLALGTPLKKTEIVLREANSNDIPQILELSKITDSFRISEHINKIDKEELIYWVFDSRSIVIVAIDQSRVIGYAYGTCISKKWFYFDAFFITPEFRNYGIGKKMYSYLRDICYELGIKLIQGLVIDENNLRYWVALGFEEGKRCIWVEDWLNDD